MHKYSILTLFIFINTFLVSIEIDLWSKSAILVDYNTEQILYKKNIDSDIPPASMTKLITLFLTYEEISKGNIAKTDLVSISSKADWRNLPRDSSFMFIEEGQKVTLLELMIGLAIPSGNDAAIAIAEYISGSTDLFIEKMNMEMQRLGFKTLRFVDTSGFDDYNNITVREFVEFCIYFTKKYPQSLDELFSLRKFTYPHKSNGNSSIGSIKQFNHNPMVELYPGCDGLKTGFIHKSGMNISITAKRDNRRVFAVLTGIKDKNKKRAALKRIVDCTKLLDYGLKHNKNIHLDKISLPPISVKNGTIQSIIPVIPYKRIFSINTITNIKYNISSIKAPVSYGQFLGSVTLYQNGHKHTFPIYSETIINKRSFINKFLYR